MIESLLAAADKAIEERRYEAAREFLLTAKAGTATPAQITLRLAQVTQSLGDLPQALAYARDACAASPSDPRPFLLLAQILRDTENFAEAVTTLEAALALRPNDVEVLAELAKTARAAGMATSAEALYRAALAVAPDNADFWRALGETQMWLGRGSEGLASLERAVALRPDEVNYDSLLFHMLIAGDASGSGITARTQEFARLHGGRLPGLGTVFVNEPDPDRPLRVGFLSTSLRTSHNSLYFFAPILFDRDKAGYQVFVYGDVDYTLPGQQPLVREVVKAIDTGGLDDLQVAEAIRSDQIDVLVSALGRGSERPRARVLRFRPAPVQMCFHHVMTTGYADADYWIADPYTVPEHTSEYFSEKIVRIPWKFSFDAFTDHGPVAPLPAGRRGVVTFASTTHLWKLNPTVLECWRAILERLPTARLRIKAMVFRDDSAVASYRRVLESLQLPMDRVELWPPLPDTSAMSFYNDVDIVLDTFPYTCGNSALEALWMGVPLISLKGNRFSGRQSFSMLAAIGLGALAVPDTKSYIAGAVQLGSDIAALDALRRTMRERMRASPLFDHMGYARSVEAVIRGAWREWCRQPHP